MKKINEYTVKLKQMQWLQAIQQWLIDYRWPTFMSLLALATLALNWASLGVFKGFSIIILMAGLTWLGRQWLTMQLSLLVCTLLFFGIYFTHTSYFFIGLLIPVTLVLLSGCLLTSVLLSFRKTPLTHGHVDVACWSVIVSAGLLQLLIMSVKPDTGLLYAGMPLVSLEEILVWIVVSMMFLYLWFQRSHARVQGEYLALLPVFVMGFYSMYILHNIDIQRIALPDGRLEHALLMIHVPAMIIAFALLLNTVGFALLRLLSDSQWLRASQNLDIIETLQTGLEDYLYRQLKLAVLILGVGLFAGLLWSDVAWGHYWQDEPKLFMSLSVWFYYLAGLHFRLQRGMQMRPFAWWCLAGLPLLWMTLIGTNWWPQGFHTYTGL